MQLRSVLACLGAVFVVTTPAAAQDAFPDLSKTVEDEARQMREAAEGPADPDPGWSDNAGRRETETHSSSESHSSSSSRSSSFGLGPSREDDWSIQSVLGQWTLGEKDGGSTCATTLYEDESFGLRRAWTTAGCPDGFFSVNRWRAAGRDLQLMDMGGQVIGSFRQVGPGRFEGRRASDGAAVYLLR